MNKNIVVITKTKNRFSYIKENVPEGIYVSNEFKDPKVLNKFKRNQLIQFFHSTDLILIDDNILAGTNNQNQIVYFIEKIFSMGILKKDQMKVLYLIDREDKEAKEKYGAYGFVYTQNQKFNKELSDSLFKKVKEYLENSSLKEE
ncbi:MAG: hypothetical protein WCO35_04025 [Candidatus Nomurabacteria bacterium]